MPAASGFVANIEGRNARLVLKGVQILVNLAHRGLRLRSQTGDGAGI